MTQRWKAQEPALDHRPGRVTEAIGISNRLIGLARHRPANIDLLLSLQQVRGAADPRSPMSGRSAAPRRVSTFEPTVGKVVDGQRFILRGRLSAGRN